MSYTYLFFLRIGSSIIQVPFIKCLLVNVDVGLRCQKSTILAWPHSFPCRQSEQLIRGQTNFLYLRLYVSDV